MRRGFGGGHDLRQLVTGLDKVEVSFVGLVVAVDVAVGDIDFGLDLLVEQLVLRQGVTDFALEVVEGDAALLELLVELLLGVRRLHLSELCVDVLVSRSQVELCGALLDDLVINQIAQNTETYNIRLLGARLLGVVAEIGFVIFLHLRAQNLFSIHRGHYVRRRRAMAANQGGEQKAAGENRDGETTAQQEDRFDLQPDIS